MSRLTTYLLQIRFITPPSLFTVFEFSVDLV